MPRTSFVSTFSTHSKRRREWTKKVLYFALCTLFMYGLFACNNGERRCESDADCVTTQTDIYCYQGFCSATPCQPGDRQTCYEGPAGTQNQGVCRTGQQICLQEGKWSACTGQITPTQEVCDRVDNDCDGKVDIGDGLDCLCKDVHAKRLCYPGKPETRDKGTCTTGFQYCSEDGRWGPCLNAILPIAESCDGFDNDCDGKIDNIERCRCKEGTQKLCYQGPLKTIGVGPCKTGIQTCLADGTWGACAGEVLPSTQTEGCGAGDTNCNGVPNEDCPCKQNEKRCDERCVNINQNPRHCGECGKRCEQNQFCIKGVCVDECTKDALCGNKCLEDNSICCNGTEITLTQLMNNPQHCGGCGVTCDQNETCCNGTCRNLNTDRLHCGECGNTCPLHLFYCVDKQCKQCPKGVSSPSTEIWDKKDNDCDGQIDNLSSFCRRECGRPGIPLCQSGKEICTPTTTVNKTCNGFDDDCDGIVDKGCSPIPRASFTIDSNAPKSPKTDEPQRSGLSFISKHTTLLATHGVDFLVYDGVAKWRSNSLQPIPSGKPTLTGMSAFTDTNGDTQVALTRRGVLSLHSFNGKTLTLQRQWGRTDLQSGKPATLTLPHYNFDGTRLATASENDVDVWNTKTLKVSHTVSFNTPQKTKSGRIRDLTFSPDRDILAFVTTSERIKANGDPTGLKTLWVWDIKRNTAPYIQDLPVERIPRVITWHPNGRILALIGKKVTLWDLTQPNAPSLIVQKDLQSTTHTVQDADFNRDGSLLAIGVNTGNAIEIHYLNVPKELFSVPAQAQNFASKVSFILQKTTIQTQTQTLTDLLWHPSGTQLFVTLSQSQLFIINVK